MPYRMPSDLPESVQNHLPKDAQKIFLGAYNSAYEHYKSASTRRGDATREETANRVAWHAVKQKYKKGSSDKWVKI